MLTSALLEIRPDLSQLVEDLAAALVVTAAVFVVWFGIEFATWLRSLGDE